MRFAVTFETNKEVEGINTVNAICGWLYQNLALVDKELSDWLHNKGIFYDKKIMKPIHFSPLYKVLSRNRCYGIKLSSKMPKVLYAISQIFENPSPLVLKRQVNGQTEHIECVVKGVKLTPFRNTKKFFTLSPIILKDSQGFIKLDFTKDEDIEKARQIIESNLIWKYNATHSEKRDNLSVKVFQPLNMNTAFYTCFYIIQDGISKKVPVTGYTGEFILIADRELLETAYYYGIGASTAMGFGCIESGNSGNIR